jgi:uncharacterized protein
MFWRVVGTSLLMKILNYLQALVIVSLAGCAPMGPLSAKTYEEAIASRNPAIARLFEAARSGDVESARALLDSGLPVDSRIASGQTALFFAAYYDRPALVGLFLAKGANPNARDDPLGEVPEYVRVGSHVRYGGVYVEELSHQRSTPLIYASLGRSAKSAEMLLDAGADLNAVDDRGRSAWTVARDPGTVQLFLAHRIDPNRDGMRSSGGGPESGALGRGGKPIPVTWLAADGETESLRLIIDAGANVDARGWAGDTALYIATTRGNHDMMRMLLTKGADPNLPGAFEQTPLQMAVFQDSPESLEILIQAGGRLDIAGGNQKTPVQIAVKRRYPKAYDYLKRLGYSPPED